MCVYIYIYIYVCVCVPFFVELLPCSMEGRVHLTTLRNLLFFLGGGMM